MLKRVKQALKGKPVIISLGVVIGLTITIAIGAVIMVHQYVAASAALQQSFNYNLSLERLLSEVRNAASNQRQYLITGDQTYATSYAQSIKDVNDQLSRLQPLLTPKQYGEISGLASSRLAFLSKATDTLQSGDRQAAIEYTANIEGLRITSKLTNQISSLEKKKTSQIQQQRLATERLSNLVLVAIAGGTLLSCVLIGFVVRLVYELERKERALRRSQAELQSIVDYAPNYIQMLDLNLKRIFINRAGTQNSSYPILGRQFGDFMDKEERRRVHRVLRRVLKTGRSVDFEFSARIDGNELWYKNSVGPIESEGRITGLVLITFDVTREKQGRMLLEEQKKSADSARIFSHALLDSIGEGLLVIDEHGVITSANPSAASALGYDVKALIGKWFPGVVVELDDQGKTINPLNRPSTQALMTGRTVSETVWYQRKDSTIFPVAVTVSPVIIEGRPVGAIEVFRDLTNERELEQAKEEFVSLASHQLRTPATGAKAYISLLLDGYGGVLTERQKEYVQKIHKSNERQLEIINDMLNVARIDSGRIMPEMISIDIAELLRETIEEQQPIVVERRQRLRLTVPSKTVTVVCDPKLIHMALENILNNASKYTYEDGTIDVKLKFSGSHAHIRIKDTGVGIAVEDQSKIFQRFGRVYNPLSVARGGTGLGLYLTRNIIDMHHGQISVDSKLGAGTIFDIDLPTQPLASLSAREGSDVDSHVVLRRET